MSMVEENSIITTTKLKFLMTTLVNTSLLLYKSIDTRLAKRMSTGQNLWFFENIGANRAFLNITFSLA